MVIILNWIVAMNEKKNHKKKEKILELNKLKEKYVFLVWVLEVWPISMNFNNTAIHNINSRVESMK